jgi:phosphopantothenoylcysteine decarboxylase/phosphopantothenate--cysteine ligase
MDNQKAFNIFNKKKIIVGITGSIAAYKSLLLIRELTRKGANVFPVMTPSAANFVTPLSVSNLAKSQVAIDMFAPEVQRSGAWHIDLVSNADLMIIAPATATTIAKIANGICDNSLVTVATALPKDIPLIISPAMDTSMWENPITQRNVKILEEIGVVIIPPAVGELSSGHFGEGRLPEIPVLLDYIETCLFFKEIGKNHQSITKSKLKGKKVLLTAGPTIEKIDDVRFISNFSSGKMGLSLANKSHILGAQVTLIAGPTKLQTHHNIEVVKVESSSEMYEKVIEYYAKNDIVIMASAVADYTPASKFTGKVKKDTADELNIKLKRTKDILEELGKRKKSQFLVGFALEDSSTGLKNAWRKLVQKNCDMIVLNYFDKEHSGFGGDENTITLLGFESNDELFIHEYPPMDKNLCAMIILERISQMLK